MCTRVMWASPRAGVLVGRNMDWLADMDTRLRLFPRGAHRIGTTVGRAHEWDVRYGSVATTVYDLATPDGLNEAGLSASLLWLQESDYGPREPERPGLAVTLWAQYFLDTCATVAEAVDRVRAEGLQLVGGELVDTGKFATLHLALGDAGGDNAVIEVLDGQTHVHHDREYTVLTNSPPYPAQLENRARFQGFGGDRPLPGSTEASDRFVRASTYVRDLPPVSDPVTALAALASVMRNAAQPYRVPDPDHPEISHTLWSVLADLKGRRYVFDSLRHLGVVWVDLAKVDLTAGSGERVLDLVGDDRLIGDVTDRFVPAEPLPFQLA